MAKVLAKINNARKAITTGVAVLVVIASTQGVPANVKAAILNVVAVVTSSGITYAVENKSK